MSRSRARSPRAAIASIADSVGPVAVVDLAPEALGVSVVKVVAPRLRVSELL